MMEENKNSNQSDEDNINGNWYDSNYARIAILAIVIVLAYIGFNQIRESYVNRNVTHTTGVSVGPDSLNMLLFNDSIRNAETGDSELNRIEKLQNSNSESTLDHVDSTSSTKDSGEVDLFKLNTHYDKIKVDPAGSIFSSKSTELRTGSNDLFDALLIPIGEQAGFNRELYERYYKADFISFKSTLKILGIAGKQLLMGNNSADSQSMLQTISESNKVQSLIIIDNYGAIKYASDQKIINNNIHEVMPDIDQDKSTLSWYKKDDMNIITFPLFHTYGRLGMAVVIIKISQ